MTENKTELTIQVPRAKPGATPPEGAQPNVLGNAAGPNLADAEAIRARRREIHKKFDDQQGQPDAGAPLSEAEPAEAPELPEDLESVELQLPNGAVVEFGPPPGISLQMRLARMLGSENANLVAQGLYRILMCVRSINGQKVPAITTKLEAERVANLVGDNGIDILSITYHTYWPPPKVNDLPVVKKNQRIS